MRHALFQVPYRHHVIPTTLYWRYYNYLHLIMRKLAQGHLASKQQTFDPLIFLPLLEGLNGGRTYWKVCRLLVLPSPPCWDHPLQEPADGPLRGSFPSCKHWWETFSVPGVTHIMSKLWKQTLNLRSELEGTSLQVWIGGGRSEAAFMERQSPDWT